MVEVLSRDEIAKRKSDRYGKRAEEVDAFGRIIVVRPLKPGEQMRLMKILETEDGTLRGMASVAAAVCRIGDIDWSFPRSFEDIQITMDTLDPEGLDATVKALEKLGEATRAAEADVYEAAKNSPPSPTSSNSPG